MIGNSKTNFLITREPGLFCMVVVLAFTIFFLGGQPGLAQEKVFFGNLHSHTSYSDGLGKPRDAFLYARDIAKLDFLALTEHNHAEAQGNDGIGIATNPALYKGGGANSLISSARAFTENDRFIALYGQEFSTIVGTAQKAPFTVTLTDLKKRHNMITVVATDSGGARTAAIPIMVIVRDKPGHPQH